MYYGFNLELNVRSDKRERPMAVHPIPPTLHTMYYALGLTNIVYISFFLKNYFCSTLQFGQMKFKKINSPQKKS